MLRLSFLAVVLLLTMVVFGDQVSGERSPPQAKIEALFPKGLRISIPEEKGLTWVALYVKVNEDFKGTENRTVLNASNTRGGQWTYHDPAAEVRIGDIIFYCISYVYMGRHHFVLTQHYQVAELYNTDGVIVNTGTDNMADRESEPCAPTDTKVVDPKTGERRDVCAGRIVLNDHFDTLNETLWRQVEMFAGSPDYPFVVYRKDPRNVDVINGSLKIVPTLTKSEYGEEFVRHGNLTLERCTGELGSQDCQRHGRGPYILPPVMSGSMDTRDSFAFLYGKVQIRAKLPRGDWIYPVIGLEPLDASSSSWNSTRRLRVVFSAGNLELRGSSGIDLGGRLLCGGTIKCNSESRSRKLTVPKIYAINPWSDDYHLYELEWRRDKIISRVDGREYGFTKTEPPFDKPFYLKLGVAVGGPVEFADRSVSAGHSKPWRNVGAKAVFDFFNATDLWAGSWIDDAKSLKIDYVRVWAL